MNNNESNYVRYLNTTIAHDGNEVPLYHILTGNTRAPETGSLTSVASSGKLRRDGGRREIDVSETGHGIECTFHAVDGGETCCVYKGVVVTTAVVNGALLCLMRAKALP